MNLRNLALSFEMTFAEIHTLFEEMTRLAAEIEHCGDDQSPTPLSQADFARYTRTIFEGAWP